MMKGGRLDPVAVFYAYLKQNGLRMTEQRGLVLRLFIAKEGHFTVEELYQDAKAADPTIGQATVYRNLKLLSASGLARSVNFEEGVSHYEHSYGHEHHDHLVCDCCNQKIEVYNAEIEKLQEAIAKLHGYKLTGHKLFLYGLCATCQGLVATGEGQE